MKIGIVAGETSGDLLGANLIGALRRHFPQAQFVGIAGPRMQALGAQSLFPMEKLAVRGYAEVLRHLHELLSIRKQLARHFLAQRPDVFVGIDAPDFNLGLEAKLKRAGIATLQYVGPQIWAWRAERVESIKRAVSRVLTLFPFETELYERAGVPVSFVGHPLADMVPLQVDRAEARANMRLTRADPVVALLPGSRVSELHYHAQLFVETAELLLRTHENAVFLAPMVSQPTLQLFEQALAQSGIDRERVRIMHAHAQHALACADIALVASGTATLEAALYKCPMVITYKLSRISHWLITRKMTLPYVGLPNVLAQEKIVPEYLQDDANAANLAQALATLLADKDARARMIEHFTRLHESLRQDNAERTAQALLPYLNAGAAVRAA
jgi:lipid-A-disaccharide synthase